MLALTQTSTLASTTATLSEVELLFCCARTHLDTTTAERIKTLLQKQIDWAELIQISVHHGVMPLLYRSLKKTCPEAVPKNILKQLQLYFHTNKLRNQFLTYELLKLLNLFQEYDIPAIPFKGAILAVSAYGSLAFRTFGDLDILVHQQDFLRAKDLLLSHGYRSTTQWFLTVEQEVAARQEQGEYSLISHDGRVNLDLHKRLVAGYLFTLSADLDYFWECLEPVSLLDQTVLSFRAEETLLYLCIHGAKSFWERLRWICDVAELIRTHQELDWKKLIEQSQNLGCERMFLLGCFLASDLLGTKLPEAVSSKIDADAQIKSLASQVYQRLKGETKYPSQEKYTFASFIFHIKAMERLEDKFRYSLKCLFEFAFYPLRRIFNPNACDREFFSLPRPLYFLYYLIRPVRLMRKFGLMIWQRLGNK